VFSVPESGKLKLEIIFIVKLPSMIVRENESRGIRHIIRGKSDFCSFYKKSMCSSLDI